MIIQEKYLVDETYFALANSNSALENDWLSSLITNGQGASGLVSSSLLQAEKSTTVAGKTILKYCIAFIF